MAVKQIAEQVIEPLRVVPPAEPVPERRKPKPAGRRKPKAITVPDEQSVTIHAIGLMTVIAKIVSVRLVLMLATVGAFGLAAIATMHPSLASIAVMGLYDVFVFVPVILLESGMLQRIKS